MIAEFLIYDFRFWYDVDCYRKQAEAVHRIRNRRKKIDRYDKEQEANLLRKAEQICDHFMKSQILPQCRINVQEQDFLSVYFFRFILVGSKALIEFGKIPLPAFKNFVDGIINCRYNCNR